MYACTDCEKRVRAATTVRLFFSALSLALPTRSHITEFYELQTWNRFAGTLLSNNASNALEVIHSNDRTGAPSCMTRTNNWSFSCFAESFQTYTGFVQYRTCTPRSHRPQR